MNKYDIIRKIENFASVETAEPWDCVGFEVETENVEVSKVMLCLTVTDSVVEQARAEKCDMIISHHPLFYVPLEWSDIGIYSAHTNLDKANGGTTDTLIQSLDFKQNEQEAQAFLRFVDFDTPLSLDIFIQKLKKISPNLRYVNNKNIQHIKKAAFCAGSGAEFINTAQEYGADCLVTGDLKFHTALDSQIIVFDIGHFESEILILPVLKSIIGDEIEVIFAREQSPFKY